MNPMVVFVMVGQTILFLAWAFIVFRTLIRLNNIATERRIDAGMGPVGMTGTLGTFGDFLMGRVLPQDRVLLILLTLALFAGIALRSSFN